MTDAAFVLNDTNRERAITKRSAVHRKCGSKSKKCTLEVDKMSQKEIEKRHGPVESWKMSEFYTVKEFKKMPKDIQVEYLNYLMDKYGVGLQTISIHLFGMSKTWLTWYANRPYNNYLSKLHKCTKSHTDDRERFISDIQKAFWPEKTEEEPESITIAELDAQTAEKEKPRFIHGVPLPQVLIEEIFGASEEKMTIDEVFHPIDETPEEEEPIFYHDSSYVSSYIRMGLDMSELFKLSTLFENKKVHVDLKITVL